MKLKIFIVPLMMLLQNQIFAAAPCHCAPNNSYPPGVSCTHAGVTVTCGNTTVNCSGSNMCSAAESGDSVIIRGVYEVEQDVEIIENRRGERIDGDAIKLR